VIDTHAIIDPLPEAPGVYRMVDADRALLYVGKAKNLRKRVASYFQRGNLSPRIQLMVQQVAHVETTVTRSEAEALLLENNLIKGLQPKYNIIYRDDKSYPYIMLSGHPFPRIAFHRGPFDKTSRYHGPFPSAAAVRESIQLLQKVFLLRTCENPVFENRSRPCLLHQIQRCTAPCVGLIDESEYATEVRLAEWFLEGRHGDVIERLTSRMEEASERLRFEQAALYRDQIRSLQKVLHRTYVSSGRSEDADIVTAVSLEGVVCLNLAMVRGGRHLGDRPQFAANAQQGTDEEILTAFLGQHYLDHPAPARILIDRDATDDMIEAAAFATGREMRIDRPRNEMERAWMEMAKKNAAYAIRSRISDASRGKSRVEALCVALSLSEPPERIECFDVSHTSGESVVAACVVRAAERMQKSEYRRYNVTGVKPGDDYAAMRQVLTRRYEKVAAGEGVRPDLILVDGGRGQLAVACSVLVELGLPDIPVVGVAKGADRRPGHEELVFADARPPLQLSSDSPALHLIQEVRDEAHRFAVAGHRARRANSRRVSSLEGIPGIGPMRRRRLLAQFGGLQGVVAATVDDLCRAPGISRKLAEQIFDRLH